MKYHEKIAEVYNKIFHILKEPLSFILMILIVRKHTGQYFLNVKICSILTPLRSVERLIRLFRCRKKQSALVTASGGNHGLAVSYAAKVFGLKAVVVVPEFVPQFRRDMI